jgi:hypothetical protein
MFMLRKSDWDPQKPCIILIIIHKLVHKERATKPETPDSRLLTPNPTNKLFAANPILEDLSSRFSDCYFSILLVRVPTTSIPRV